MKAGEQVAGERALKELEKDLTPRWQILLMLDNIRRRKAIIAYLREEVGENYRMSIDEFLDRGLSDFENPVYGSLYDIWYATNELLEAYDRTLALNTGDHQVDTTSLFKQRSTRPITYQEAHRYWLDQEDVPSEQIITTLKMFFRALSSGVRDSEILAGSIRNTRRERRSVSRYCYHLTGQGRTYTFSGIRLHG
ncbi:hypothetical protein SPFM20_00247 [Salmonella phage SPFM20]|nr:hypothetical protein SPFM8_00247 [Salmonella phage SPFM8]VFR14925.1 hypothetical protein SPFM20_00247 [Salmonella phage SPFM20]